MRTIAKFVSFVKNMNYSAAFVTVGLVLLSVIICVNSAREKNGLSKSRNSYGHKKPSIMNEAQVSQTQTNSNNLRCLKTSAMNMCVLVRVCVCMCMCVCVCVCVFNYRMFTDWLIDDFVMRLVFFLLTFHWLHYIFVK